MNNENGTNGNGHSENGTGLPKKVGIIHSEVKREYFPTEEQYITEKDAIEEAEIIAMYIRKLNVEVKLYPADDTLQDKLKTDEPDMVFNLVDSIKGKEYLSTTVPGVLEMLDIPYTGANILGLALCYNKFLTTKFLQQAGIPVPNFQLVYSANDVIDYNLRYPLISKLNEIHGGVEITEDAVSENERELKRRIKYLIEIYKQPVLVQEYIVGREIAAVVLQGKNVKVYFGEKIFESKNPTSKYLFDTFEFSWLNKEDGVVWHFEKYNNPRLKEIVKKAFDIAKMEDYGKFDIREDASGRYFFIDTNPNTQFGPIETKAPLSMIATNLYGVKFEDILRRLMVNTYTGKVTDFDTEHPEEQ